MQPNENKRKSAKIGKNRKNDSFLKKGVAGLVNWA